MSWQPQGSCIGKSIQQFIFGFGIHSNLICKNPDWRWLTFLKFLVSKSMAKVANRTLSDSSDELVLLFCTLNLIGRAILCQVLPQILSREMSCLSRVSAMILQRVTRCVRKEKLCVWVSLVKPQETGFKTPVILPRHVSHCKQNQLSRENECIDL